MSEELLFSLRTDVALVPAGSPATRHILLTLTAPEAARAAGRQPIHVSFVLDRSGSMGGSKIRLALDAVRQALQMLRADDRFALVAYDDVVDVVVPSTGASAEAKRRALDRLAEIDGRGSTDLAGGWREGCEQVAPHAAEEPHGRCLLLTDGLANVGETDPNQLAARAASVSGLTVACDRHPCFGHNRCALPHHSSVIDPPVPAPRRPPKGLHRHPGACPGGRFRRRWILRHIVVADRLAYATMRRERRLPG